jgi:branched-chain amino acid transport system permease protein
MTGLLSVRNVTIAALVLGLLLLPVYVQLTGDRFLLTLFSRIVILALAASSLNLISASAAMRWACWRMKGC